jgi:hypothetical protein
MRVSGAGVWGLLVWVICLSVGAVSAAPTAQLWERWAVHDPASAATVDHAQWQAFLDINLRPSADGVNRIAYASVSDLDHAMLNNYIETLSAVSISAYQRADQLAYWINLYNALTVKVVLDNYPVSSILKISTSLFSIGPWGEKRVQVEGESLSLDDIEHRILRPIWQDSRVHYAVNCASIGCPNLRTAAFVPGDLDSTLTLAAREYINSRRGVRIENGKLFVSSIYAWFAEDFGGTDEQVIAHIKVFADADLNEQLSTLTQISDDFYDWDLNEPR